MTSDRPPPRRVASDDEDGAPAPLPNASIAEELLRRHGRSPQPSSARLIALLKATLDVLASRGLSATPGALFAALMPALETELQSGAQMDEVRAALVLGNCGRGEGGIAMFFFLNGGSNAPPRRLVRSTPRYLLAHPKSHQQRQTENPRRAPRPARRRAPSRARAHSRLALRRRRADPLRCCASDDDDRGGR